jgi:CheY-like chemotaxis protein
MPGYRVLVADDEPDIRTILRRLLLSEGFQVCEAGDGTEVLAAADRCKINIIVMDMMMPQMSGAEAVQRLRADPRYTKTPIVLITGNPVIRPMVRPCHLGDMVMLTKPLNLDEVLTVVHQLTQTA